MCKYRGDDPIQWYGALAWIGLLSIEPADITREHGALAVFTINECAIKVCAGVTYHALQIHGRPWHAYVLAGLFPRLRSEA